MSEYTKITEERAEELGKMIASFNDSYHEYVSFNSDEFIVECFGYRCRLLIIPSKGCFYKEEFID